MARLLIFVLLALPTLSLLAQSAMSRIDEKTIEHYPFVASVARSERIFAGYRQVKPGMSVSEVNALLGEADEIRALFSPTSKNAKPIGHTRWYVLRRLTDNGSANDKQEAVVRVSFNLQGRVSAVDTWGLESL